MKLPSIKRRPQAGLILFAAMYIPLGLCFSSTLFAQERNLSDPRQFIAEWFNAQRVAGERKFAELQAEQVRADAALNQALRALALAREYRDSAAEQVAQEAVAIARQAKDESAAKLPRLQPVIEGFDFAASNQSSTDSSKPVAFALGRVVRKAGTNWVPVDSLAALQPGDVIRTGPQGRAVVRFPDATFIVLDKNSEFTFRIKTKPETFYEILEGRFHIVVPPWVPGKPRRITTPTIEIGVRGTEYDVRVDERGFTHLLPYSGKLELAVQPKRIDRSKLDRWWESGNASAGVLPQGKAARVLYVEGQVKVERDGKARNASPGDVLNPESELLAGKNGFARLQLGESYLGSLAANSRMKFTTPTKATMADGYSLAEGRFYFWQITNTSQKALLIMETPTAVIEAKEAAFVVSVNKNGLSDVLPVAGKLIITGKLKHGQVGEVNPWWLEP